MTPQPPLRWTISPISYGLPLVHPLDKTLEKLPKPCSSRFELTILDLALEPQTLYLLTLIKACTPGPVTVSASLWLDLPVWPLKTCLPCTLLPSVWVINLYLNFSCGLLSNCDGSLSGTWDLTNVNLIRL